MRPTDESEDSDSDDTFYSIEDGEQHDCAGRIETRDGEQLSKSKFQQDRTEVIENAELCELNDRYCPEEKSSQPLSDILNLYITDEEEEEEEDADHHDDNDNDKIIRSILDNSNINERFGGNIPPRKRISISDSSILDRLKETVLTSVNEEQGEKTSHSFTSLVNIVEIPDDYNERDTLNKTRHPIADAPIVEFDGSKEVIIISTDDDTDADDVIVDDEMFGLKRSRSITRSPPLNNMDEELPQSPYQKKLKVLKNLAKEKEHTNREEIYENGFESSNKRTTGTTHCIATTANKNDDCNDSDENFFNYP